MTDKSANKMWGGRFAVGHAEIMEEINASIGFDKVLAPQDIRGSKAHAAMLAAKGIISKEDAAAILDGLSQVEAEIAAGKMAWQRSLEDVHMNVESRLREIIGTPAGRLHTARSRNDQVATRFPALGARPRRRARSGPCPADAHARRQGTQTCRDRDAGLHASAAGAAGDVRPSPARLRRDARARPRRGCATPARG